MRISDWSSDVCSSDLILPFSARDLFLARDLRSDQRRDVVGHVRRCDMLAIEIGRASCRERVCQLRVDLGGRGIIKKQKYTDTQMQRPKHQSTDGAHTT